MNTKVVNVFIYVILLLSIVRCNSKKLDTYDVYSFSLYNGENKIIKEKFYTMQRFHLNDIDSVIINDSSKREKGNSFLERIDYPKSIMRKYDSNFVATHSFTIDLKVKQPFSQRIVPPFMNRSTKLLKEKVYRLNNANYSVYHFSEFNGTSSGYSSYYLKDVGFICYYNYQTDRYVLCDSSTQDYSIIKHVNKLLIQDTLFFAKYIFRKLDNNNVIR